MGDLEDADCDESMREALAAAVEAITTRSSDASATATSSLTSSSSTSSTSLARSPAFFEALCLLCRHAAPLEVVRAAARGDDDEEEEEGGQQQRLDSEPLPPRSQRLLLAALAAARALRGPAPRGYEARVLQQAAKDSGRDLSDDLAGALASSLVVVVENNKAGEGERGAAAERSPSLVQPQAFFFGFSLEKEGESTTRRPTLSSTRSFPVAVSSSPDVLSGSTGKALWPASRALSSLLLSDESELVRGKAVIELGCGVGLVGAALSLGSRWWLRRRREGEEKKKNGDDDGGDSKGKVTSFSPLSLLLTDGDSGSVANARRTLEVNGIEENEGIGVSVLDWLCEPEEGEEEGEKNGKVKLEVEEVEVEVGKECEEEEAKKQTSSPPPTLVVGSDIMYDPESAAALSAVLASLLLPEKKEKKNPSPPEALLAGVVRSGATAAAFELAFSKAGLAFESSSSSSSSEELSPPVSRPSLSRKVRAWHAGDEGIEVRWWRLKKKGKEEIRGEEKKSDGKTSVKNDREARK